MNTEVLPDDAVAVPFMRGHYACPDGRIYSTLHGIPKLRKYGRNSSGYATCPVDGKGWLVHKVIATMFLQSRPIQSTINHKDLNKLNNRVENLEWISLVENARHWRKLKKAQRTYNGRRVTRIGPGEEKIRYESVKAAGEGIQLEISEKGGVPPKSVSPAISRAARRNSVAYGYRWRW